MVDMSVHLPWLAGRLRALGGAIERHHVAALDELDADAVVNCAGLGARELAADASLSAVRGQIVRVRAPAVQEWLLDQSDPERLVYVVPRERDVVLGGTAQEGAEGRAADPATTAAIRARCAALVPALHDAPVVSVAVGLRPVRPTVRLEADGARRALLRPRRRRRDPRVGVRRRGSRTSRRARRALRCSAVK